MRKGVDRKYANSKDPDQTAKPYYLIKAFSIHIDTLKPLYNTVRYNMVLDITRFKDGSQKCIDHIEK